MIVDYELADSLKPSDSQVWLMVKRAEKAGYTVDMTIINAMCSGDVRFVHGKWYKLCRACMEFKELDEFYGNKRYTLGVTYVCKDCTATRRRIKNTAKVRYVSDSGMKHNDISGATVKLSNDTKEIIKKELDKDELERC